MAKTFESAPSPRSVTDAVDLMFTFDGEFGEELTIGLATPGTVERSRRSSVERHSRVSVDGLELEAAELELASPAGWCGCHKYAPLSALLGTSQLSRGGTAIALDQNQQVQAKTAQLLMQWLALPATDSLVKMLYSQARRALPISRDLLEDALPGGSEEHRAKHRAALPLAPARTHMRWSVSGGTPRRPPMATPGSADAATPRKRRNSEPNLPVLAFDTPSPHGKPPVTPRGSVDDSGCHTNSTATPRGGRTNGSNRSLSPGSDAKAPFAPFSAAREASAHSPLTYFGTQPDVSCRFASVPHGDGGTLAFFEAEAGGAGLRLAPESLFKVCNERLDLPKAVAKLVVQRSQERQKAADEQRKAGAGGDKENGMAKNVAAVGGGSAGGGSPSGATPSSEGGAAVAEGGQSDTPWQGEDKDRPVGFAAFSATYGVHRPEEADRIRLFRLIKRHPPACLTKADITELVWAIASTHSGLEFLRDSEEFLKAYVQTTVLRIMWALSGASSGRISLQHWRRSSVTEVLFQLDEEADINLARDYFSYNHFYVIWCLFWELDEDEDSHLTKDDLLRYGSYGLSSRVVDRIWALRHEASKPGMSYSDFVYFLLAEEDKQTSPALTYWFHVLDIDGDGYLSASDMRWFYEELMSRLEAMNEEIVSFDELSNELFDIVRPSLRGRVSLAELRRSKLGFNFVSALTNVRKYIAWEGLSCEKAAGRASNLRETRDWDLFADSEYRRLVESEDEGSAEAPGPAEPDEGGEDAETVQQSI